LKLQDDVARPDEKYFGTPTDRLLKSSSTSGKETAMAQDEGVWMHCTNSAIRRAARQLGQLYDDIVAPAGLKSTQFTLIAQIGVSGSPSLKALAEAMVMDLSALGHTLKPLIRDELVELVPDEKDKRVKRARLTSFGKAKQNEMLGLWREAQDRFDNAFGQEQSAEIRRALALISAPAFAEAFRNKDKEPSERDSDQSRIT
jgi:DNA-binding MarR family transcriptional regulator